MNMFTGGGKRIRSCTSSSNSNSNSNPVEIIDGEIRSLPVEIIEREILCRLPVKSLLRYKSVCKLWYSIIKNPNFISNHYHHQSNRRLPLIGENCRILTTGVPIEFNPPVQAPYAVWPICHQIQGNPLFPYYIGMTLNGIFVRPVDGFLLILQPNKSNNRGLMTMFNPATRQVCKPCCFKFIPPYAQLFGYGICKYNAPQAHVYKVVRLKLRKDGVAAKVFTVGRGSDRDKEGWRVIATGLPRKLLTKYTNQPGKNMSLNGKCYWVSGNLAHILVFDFDKESFQEINSPVPRVDNSVPVSRLPVPVFSEVQCGGYKGTFVALFVFEYGSSSFDMFVLEKEDEWRWIHRTITCIDRPLCELVDPIVQLEFPRTDNPVLLKCGRSSFALYNPKTNKCLRFHQSKDDDNMCGFVKVFNFKESLFTLDGGIQVSDHVLQDFSAFKLAE